MSASWSAVRDYRAAEEGNESLEGGRLPGSALCGTEAAWAGLLGQSGAGERQRLVGQPVRDFEGGPGGLTEIPPVGEEVVEAHLQSLTASGRPQRALEGVLQDAWLVERGP